MGSKGFASTGALRAKILYVAHVSCLSIGCNQTDAGAQTEQPAAQVASTQPEPAPATAASGQAAQTGQEKYAEEAFIAQIVPPASLTAGTVAQFRILLEAQNGYKVNDEYPIKFVVQETPDVKPTKPTVRKEDGKVEKLRAELPVSVTVSKPGEHQVGGKLSFSVCTDERCLIEKRDLLITIGAS